MVCLTSKRWSFRSTGSDPIPQSHHSIRESHDPSFTSLAVSASSCPQLSILWLPEVSSYSLVPTALCCTLLADTRAALCSPGPSEKPSAASRHCTMAGCDLPSGRALSTHKNYRSSLVGTLSCFTPHLPRSALLTSTCPPSPVPFHPSPSSPPTTLGRQLDSPLAAPPLTPSY